MTLIVVSNRVAFPAADEPIEGGLAAALLPAVQTCGATWVGASQCSQEVAKESFAAIESYGVGTIATVSLPKSQYRGFYEGFSNSALWPALHSRPDLIRTSRDEYDDYRTINTLMARALIRFAKPDAIFWIHDYHYLALGAKLDDVVKIFTEEGLLDDYSARREAERAACDPMSTPLPPGSASVGSYKLISSDARSMRSVSSGERALTSSSPAPSCPHARSRTLSQ